MQEFRRELNFWRMLKLSELNESQRQAVAWEGGPLLLLAGPGSGKTHTLVNRILYLLEKGADPSSILVITFTKDAAVSMQQRFFALSNQYYPVSFGTFHSLFYHIIQRSSGTAKRNFLSGVEKKRHLIPILREYFLQKNQYVTAQELDADADQLLTAISFYKNTSKLDSAIRKAPHRYQEDFSALFEEYQHKIKALGALDYDDMLFECRHLLAHDVKARKEWQNRFSHILIDEFQDTNPVQYEVIRMLTGPDTDLFAVGDDDQAIYGFRGTKPDILRDFERDYHASRLYLPENYRSLPGIVQASTRVISGNRNRYEKKLTAVNPEENWMGYPSFRVRSFEVREQQYAYLSDEIRRFLEHHQEDGQTLAVIFRTNLMAQALATRLTHQGIPFAMKEKVRNVYEHFLVKDIMAYLLLASGEGTREHLLRILNKPSRYLHREAVGEDGTFVSLRSYYRRDPKGYGAHMTQLEQIDLLERQLKLVKDMPMTLAVNYICKAIRYEEYLRRKAEYDPGVCQEWEEVLTWLKEDAMNYRNVREWVEAQELYAKTLALGQEKRAAKHFEPIRLMTAHSSKGLEFTRVLIPDCNEKVYPHGNSLESETVEEERRLFYVAMTRAQKSLELIFLTGEKTHPRLPSRFINDFIREKHFYEN